MRLAKNSERIGRVIDYGDAGSMEEKKNEGISDERCSCEPARSVNLCPPKACHRPGATAKSLLRFITCGSVDDGKSTLSAACSTKPAGFSRISSALWSGTARSLAPQGEDTDFALLVDGLAAEREQGITIDVAYRYFSTPRRSFIAADTPGHEQYTRNMATGASSPILRSS